MQLAKKLIKTGKNWGKAQRESTRCPKSDWGKNLKERGEISAVAKSHDPHSNALAYAKRALST